MSSERNYLHQRPRALAGVGESAGEIVKTFGQDLIIDDIEKVLKFIRVDTDLDGVPRKWFALATSKITHGEQFIGSPWWANQELIKGKIILGLEVGTEPYPPNLREYPNGDLDTVVYYTSFEVTDIIASRVREASKKASKKYDKMHKEYLQKIGGREERDRSWEDNMYK